MDVAQNTKSMDVAMLSHSISKILQWMNSLKPLANKLSRIDVKQLEKNIKQINDKVQKHHPNSLLFPHPWLQKVKEVLIDLSDLMEDLRQKEGTSGGLKVKDRFKATLQVKKATDELKRLLNEEATDELKRLLNEEDAKGAAAEVNTDDRRKFAYDDFVAVGRENEKKEILDQLLNLKSADADDDAAVPVVIAIVGAPRIGKTKLATLVCEDDQVKANSGFQPIWINDLHQQFDVESITRRITTTEGEHVLLVIDDLQIEIQNDDLKKLQKKLKEEVGCTNIAILVTTRSNHVADNIAARHVLKLQGLNQEESWSLFQQIHGPITSTKKEQSSTEPESEAEPEREIVRDCGGVPDSEAKRESTL